MNFFFRRLTAGGVFLVFDDVLAKSSLVTYTIFELLIVFFIFTHGQLLVGEVVVGAVDVMWKQISDKFISTNSFYIILKSIHVPFKHHIPNCWHVAWVQEPKADSYFYIFLLKKKKKKSHPSFHHHLQQHHNDR